MPTTTYEEDITESTYIRFTAPRRAAGLVPTLSLHVPGERARKVALTTTAPKAAFQALLESRTEKAPWSFPLKPETIEHRSEAFLERYRYWLLDNAEEVAREALRLAWD